MNAFLIKLNTAELWPQRDHIPKTAKGSVSVQKQVWHLLKTLIHLASQLKGQKNNTDNVGCYVLCGRGGFSSSVGHCVPSFQAPNEKDH